jgi:hypothetical protein
MRAHGGVGVNNVGAECLGGAHITSQHSTPHHVPDNPNDSALLLSNPHGPRTRRDDKPIANTDRCNHLAVCLQMTWESHQTMQHE